MVQRPHQGEVTGAASRITHRSEHDEGHVHWAAAGGASAEEWVPELTKNIRQERRMGWIGPLMFGLFTAIGIFLILDRPEHPWFGVFCTITFLGLAVWFPISMRRRRSRIHMD